jgi:hypothetical protein
MTGTPAADADATIYELIAELGFPLTAAALCERRAARTG